MKGVIRVGDPTTHGGKVLSGCDDYEIQGKAVAREGDPCSCPIQGHSGCKIAEGDPNHIVGGKAVAFDGAVGGKAGGGAFTDEDCARAGRKWIDNAWPTC